MNDNMHRRDTDKLARLYSTLVVEKGDSAEAVMNADRETQEQRMRILSEVGDVANSKILDFGCGTAHLLTYLRTKGYHGEYVGYDISDKMIAECKTKFPDVRFECRNVLDEGVPERFDYILISGVFNNLVDDNWGLMTELLKTLYPKVKKALAFNALSTYVDYFDDGLYYLNPERVFKFCKEALSPLVTLRHNYHVKKDVLPYEFTVYVYSSQMIPARDLSVKSAL